MEKILILGGTNFIGRNIVERLSSRDKYELTLLNRGITNLNLFPNLKRIVGDRNTEEIGELVKGNWDYIIDVSCYFPISMEQILKSTSKNLKKYIFISTCSVYVNDSQTLKDESTAIQQCTKEYYSDDSDKSYGMRKAACEELLKFSGLNYTILRPALVYGRYDHTDRFYYWLHQVNNYNRILIPNGGRQNISLTYVQDLINSIELSINRDEDKNTCNIISHPEISIASIVEFASKLLNKSPELVSVPANYLLENDISEWVKMPLWINSNSSTFSNKKLLDSFDLKIVGLEKSMKETLLYYRNLNWPKPKYGISRMKQLELINNYKQR